MTPLSFNDELDRALNSSRAVVCQFFTDEDLIRILGPVMPDSVSRRYETQEVRNGYKERVKLWRKG